jgi:C1A family cysteine protease
MNRRKVGGAVAALAIAGAVGAICLPAISATAAPTSARPAHGLGARLDARPSASHAQALRALGAGDAPSSFSLSQYDSGPGDQGQVGSCVSWAIDYSAYDIVEKEQGVTGYPQAPMYTYAQIAKGNDNGSTPDQTFQILESQGVDNQADYTQGNFDFTDQPTQHEIQNAAKWKLSGHTALQTGSGIQADVEKSIAAGEPVAISIEVHKSWMNITQQDAQSYNYEPGDDSSDPIEGGHEVTIIGYDSQGVRIENSWGTSWGDGGYINVSWQFLQNQAEEANAVGKLVQS